MNTPRKTVLGIAAALILASAVPAPVYANASGTEDGDDVAIVFDLVVTRPVGLVAMLAGAVGFVVALPISLPSGSVGKTWNALVKEPAKYTFTRELGTSKSAQ
jgi:hypothetical protein